MALITLQVKAQSTASVAKALTAIKVVDNKGTIKYFQSNNGITQIVNTTGALTTTTWQLGGTLTDNTYIDVNGKAFALDGLALTSLAASTNTTTLSSHGTGSGYTLLVRDEATGAVQKMLATNLISGGVGNCTVSTDVVSGADYTSTAFAGLATVKNRVSVYRNGVKLLQGDWAFDTTDVTKIKITTTADLPIYADDVIEVQWIK